MSFPNTSILDPDNGPTGFATYDFQFAAVPFGKKYMILSEGMQIAVVKNRHFAEIRLEQLEKSHPKLPKGTRTPVQPKSRKNKKTPSGPLVSPVSDVPVREDLRVPAPKSTKNVPSGNRKPVVKLAHITSNPLLDALS